MPDETESERYDRLARAAYDDPDKMDELVSEISSNPRPFLAGALGRIASASDYVDRPIRPPKNIKLEIGSRPRFDAYSIKGERSITFQKGFISLARDVAELHCAYESMLAFDGSVARPPALSHDEIIQVVTESVRQFANNPDGVWQESRTLKDAYARRLEWDATASGTRRTSVGFFVRMLAISVFAMGHEVGHLVYKGPLWRRVLGRQESQDEELSCDRIGAKILLDYISVPPTVFVSEPPRLSANPICNMLTAGAWFDAQREEWLNGNLEDLRKAIMESGDRGAVVFTSEHSACRSVSLAVLSLFFNVYNLVELERKRIGKPFGDDYPAFDARFANFRAACLAHPLSPEDLFSSPHGRRGPIDVEYQRFRELLIG